MSTGRWIRPIQMSGGSSSGGDVVGPASSFDTAVALFDGLTGKLLENSSVLFNAPDTNNLYTVTWVNPAAGRAVSVVDPGGPDTFVWLNAAQVLTNKTLTAPTINGGTATSLTDLSIRSTGAAFDLAFATAEVLTGSRTITWSVNDAPRAINVAGDLTFSGAFSVSAALTLTLAGAVAGALLYFTAATTAVVLVPGTTAQVLTLASTPAPSWTTLLHPLAGDGNDGNVTITAGTTTLTRDMFYNNLTITATGILVPAGFRVHVKGKLTVAAGGLIHDNGNAAVGAVAGAGYGAGSTTTGRTSSSGGAGSAVPGTAGGNGTASASSYGGTGGAGGSGGAGGAGGGGGGVSAPAATYPQPRTAFLAWLGMRLVRTAAPGAWTGGAGGGAGGLATLGVGTGGGGGAGGGLLVICAYEIDNAGTISANGGNGANGAGTLAGGGGGGGGGMVALIYTVASGSGVGTLTAAGGTKGTGAGGGANGVDGSSGAVYPLPARA